MKTLPFLLPVPVRDVRFKPHQLDDHAPGSLAWNPEPLRALCCPHARAGCLGHSAPLSMLALLFTLCPGLGCCRATRLGTL